MNNLINKIANDISEIQITYLKENGFLPDVHFLNKMYNQGELNLTDSQEDSLIQWFEIKGLR